MAHALHLTTWHPYIAGVSGRFVLDQCASLATAGAQVGLIFSRIEGLRDLTTSRVVKGLPGFVRLSDPVPTLGFKSWNLPGLRRFIPRINAAALCNRYKAYEQWQGKPDILHAHVALEAGIATLRISRAKGLDYVVTEHSSEILLGNLSPERRSAAREVYCGARAVIAVSEPLAERISEVAPSANILVIPNLVRRAVFDARRQPNPDDGPIRIASMSSLVPAKRIADAIEAIAALPDAIRARVVYDVIGDGPERRRLEEMAVSRDVAATFYGVLDHGEAIMRLSTADIFVHPSAYETFGIVVAEAMALGLPVIATRCGGPEAIVSPKAGILLNVGDVPALTSACSNVIENLKFWRCQRHDISQFCRIKFHQDAIAESIRTIYR